MEQLAAWHRNPYSIPLSSASPGSPMARCGDYNFLTIITLPKSLFILTWSNLGFPQAAVSSPLTIFPLAPCRTTYLISNRLAAMMMMILVMMMMVMMTKVMMMVMNLSHRSTGTGHPT